MADSSLAKVAIPALATSTCTAKQVSRTYLEQCAVEYVFLPDTIGGHVRPRAASHRQNKTVSFRFGIVLSFCLIEYCVILV